MLAILTLARIIARLVSRISRDKIVDMMAIFSRLSIVSLSSFRFVKTISITIRTLLTYIRITSIASLQKTLTRDNNYSYLL